MRRTLAGMTALAILLVPVAVEAQSAVNRDDVSAIDEVWAGTDAGFGLAVNEHQVVVAYYDADGWFTVAARPRSGGAWSRMALDSIAGWDSHNSLTVAIDAAGQIHAAGNMHNQPLTYFRSTAPGDVTTLQKVSVMVDPDTERSVTYPVFLTDADGHLLFKYRDGGSGRGNEIYNRLDPATGRWQRLLDTPLVDGEAVRSAYFVGPQLGPDGWFHLVWVWRDTPDAATNHDLSYARSRDLVHWERSDGSAYDLPITLSAAEIIDPVPAGGGMINNNTIPGFDVRGRPLVTYHKFDAVGNTQVFLARREAEGWVPYQITEWEDFRWEFGGWGSLDFRLRLGPAQVWPEGVMRVPVTRDGEALDLIVDEATLELVTTSPGTTIASRLASLIDVPEGMQLNTVREGGVAIAWPSLRPNRDQPATSPPAQTLWLVEPEGGMP